MAVLWGGNIGAAYPFIKIVLEGKSIQNWVADEIDRSSQAISDLDREIAEDSSPTRRRAARTQQPKLEATLRHLQTRLDDESLAHDSYVRAKPYLDRYLPNDAFQTLVLVMVVLLVGTVLKGVLVIANNVLVARLAEPGHVRPAQALLSPHLAVGPGHLQRRRLVGPDEPLHPRHVQHRQRPGDGFRKTDRRALEDDRLPGGGGPGLLAALAALADRRPGWPRWPSAG